jgi:hypothetical protein
MRRLPIPAALHHLAARISQVRALGISIHPRGRHQTHPPDDPYPSGSRGNSSSGAGLQSKGAIAETKIAAAATKLGIPVLRPTLSTGATTSRSRWGPDSFACSARVSRDAASENVPDSLSTALHWRALGCATGLGMMAVATLLGLALDLSPHLLLTFAVVVAWTWLLTVQTLLAGLLVGLGRTIAGGVKAG